jgi:tRNA(Ser,Leu) C12 N-acetylase TAN1
MAVDDPLALLDAVESQANLEPRLHEAISRVAPATECFTFHSIEEFEDRAKAIGLGWLPRLANRSFHVRLHRRGFKHVLRSPDAERFLDDALLAALEQEGTPGRISFSDPDMIISLDTIDDRAGMALWSREELVRHPLLRPE